MRSATVIESLADCYSITLLVVSLYPPFDAPVPGEIDDLCRRSAVVWPPKGAWSSFSSRWIGPAASLYRLSFDVVHVFRLAMLPHAQRFLERGPARPLAHLDLDDLESETHARIADLCQRHGETMVERFERWQAERSERAERDAFARFDRIYVCSELDRRKLQERVRGEVCVLPNAVRLPSESAPSEGGALLFVGTLGYYPNDDGARFLCAEIMPKIRNLGGGSVEVDIVGSGASPSLVAAAAASGAHVRGRVADVAPWYGRAAVVVVPVRAGGGTRIKVLEAFAYRRPVVTTTAGLEGIDAQHEEHVLVADNADDFARQCVRLIEDARLRQRLTENAWELVATRYSIESLKKTTAASVPAALRKELRSAGQPPAAM